MCKLAGTPHVGAILIVLFVVAGAVYYLLGGTCKENLIFVGKTVKPLNALNEKEEIENGLKKFRQAPSGYIKIMNEPGAKGMEPQQIEFTGPGDQEYPVVEESPFADPELEKLVKNANKGVKDVPKLKLSRYRSVEEPGASPEAVPTFTDQAR